MLSRAAIITLSLALALSPAASALAASGAAAAEPAAGNPGTAAAPGQPAAPDAAAPRGKPPAALEGDEVLVSAERLERDNRERIVTGEGAVTIRHRDMRLVADRVVYNEQTKEVVADGNVVLDTGPDRLQGEHLELNLDTRIGFMERAQGFLQTYYFTGERIEKRGPDHYFLRGGTFTTCEGVLPDWSFHATSTEVTVDEYLSAWNPTLRIKRLPVFYFPYAIFPVKRDRATGLLIPSFKMHERRRLHASQRLLLGAARQFRRHHRARLSAENRLGRQRRVPLPAGPPHPGGRQRLLQRDTNTDSQRWWLSTRNSQELPLGLHAEIDAYFQSDREFIATQGTTIEQRSSERTTSSFFINRTWSAWNFALSGRHEVSLITEDRTTLTRFPELTIGRTSTRLFGTDLFLKLTANGVGLKREDATSTVATTRLHVSPEFTWPVSLGSVARIIPVGRLRADRLQREHAGRPGDPGAPHLQDRARGAPPVSHLGPSRRRALHEAQAPARAARLVRLHAGRQPGHDSPIRRPRPDPAGEPPGVQPHQHAVRQGAGRRAPGPRPRPDPRRTPRHPAVPEPPGRDGATGRARESPDS